MVKFRLISSDGMVDIPYENAAVQIITNDKEHYNIIAFLNGNTNYIYALGYYNDLETAQSLIERMKEAYASEKVAYYKFPDAEVKQ